jgi:hypothetical protein
LQRLAEQRLEDVRTALAALERLCAPLASLLDGRDWKGCERLISDMGRARHALANAWEAAADARTPEFEREVRERVQKVLAYREWHLERVKVRRAETGERHALISRWKAYARSVAGKRRNRPALFSDVR